MTSPIHSRPILVSAATDQLDLTDEAIQTLVHVYTGSWLDYCNGSILAGVCSPLLHLLASSVCDFHSRMQLVYK